MSDCSREIVSNATMLNKRRPRADTCGRPAPDNIDKGEENFLRSE
jgi:hypothetical protein